MADAMPVDRFTLSPRRITDADWFGLEANPSGTINVPIHDPYLAPLIQPVPGARENDRECQRPTLRR